MDTQGKKYFQFGKYEIRAKIACAKSVWGSIWMSTGNNGPSWPNSGEIDIYELIGTQYNRLQQTLWYGPPQGHTATYYSISEPLCNNYHVYGFEWRPGYIQFTLDGINTNRLNKTDFVAAGKAWPFDSYNLRFLMDLQYGGPNRSDLGPYDYNELPTKGSTLYDYVHFFN